MQVLDNLLSEYEASSHGPGKWRKLSIFLQQRFRLILSLFKIIIIIIIRIIIILLLLFWVCGFAS